MAVLTALLAAALLMGLGVSIVMLGAGEATLAAHDRAARALRQASTGAVHLALADLAALPSWSALLAPGPVAPLSAVSGRLADGSLLPAAPWGGPAIDLAGLTLRLQAATDASQGPAGDPQVWRLLEYGPLDRAVPGARSGACYLVVWVADDRADSDGDPATDSNGIVAIRAVAYGPGEGLASLDVSVARPAGAGGPGGARILTIRPGS